MSKTRAMILGCNGQLGHELVRQLGEDCIPKPREVLDVTDFKAVRALLTHVRPGVVVNCAGVTSPTACERNRPLAWKVNVEAADNLVKVCALLGLPYVHVSCDQVYGANGGRAAPYTETDVPGPVNYYGVTKLSAEHAVLRLAQCMCPEFWKAGFKYWVIRTSMLYERPWRRSSNWVYQMTQFGVSRKASELTLPSDVYRSPTYAPHLAKALVWMMRHRDEIVSGIYNIANTGTPSLFEIGSLLAVTAKNGLNISLTDRERYAKLHGRNPESMPTYTGLDCNKFNEISAVPMPTWQEGIDEFSKNWEE